ncbi:MAG: glycosyl hydrolase family 28-related protein [Clostridium sp.]
MKRTKNLYLPIYDDLANDIYKISDTNKAFETIEETYKNMKFMSDNIPLVNATAEVIDARKGETTLGGKITIIDSKISAVEEKVGQISLSVKLFGAKGDGITDDSVSIQTTIDRVFDLGGGDVKLPPGVYKMPGESTLTLRSGVSLIGNNATLDFSSRTKYSSDMKKFLVSGFGSIESGIPLTSSGMTGDYTIDVPSSYLKEGDLVCITSDKKWEETDSTIYCNVGELSIVNHKISPTTIQLKNGLYDDYLLTDNAKLYKVNPLENILISGISFIGQGRNVNPDLDADYGLGFTYCKNVTVNNCSFKNIDTKQLEFRSCYNFIVDNCYFETAKYTAKDANSNIVVPCPPKEIPGRGAVQYQVRVADACTYGNITNCIGDGSRHFFNTGHSNSKLDGVTLSARGFLFGINRFITVSNCTSRNTWHAGFSTHNDAQYISFINCTSNSSGMAGFNPRSDYVTVENCVSINTGTGIYISDNARNVFLTNNNVTNCVSAISFTSNNDLDFENIVIDGNFCENCTAGITIQSNSTINQTGSIMINNNTVINCGVGGYNSAIRILFDKAKVNIRNNLIKDCQNLAFYLEKAIDISLESNFVSNCLRALLLPSTPVITSIKVLNNTSVNCITNGWWNEAYKITNCIENNNLYTDTAGTSVTYPNVITKSGATASRPTTTTGLRKGYTYCDTSINKIIWYDGTSWRDAMGNVV